MLTKQIINFFKVHSTLKTFLLVFSIFFVIIFVTTFGLLNGYFEQDEWGGLASAMNAENLPWWNFLVARNTHFSPLGILFWRSLYEAFQLQSNYYFLIELMIHAATSTLVFILAFRLTKNKKIAILTSLLFLFNSRAHQAFTHLAIFHVTTTAMFFIMLFFVYLTSIKNKLFSLKNAVILLLIFLIAISFREEGFIIVPLFLTYLVFLDRSKLNKLNVKYFVLLFSGLFVSLFARYFAQTLNNTPVPLQYQITGDGAIYNLIFIPLKLVVQNLIYSERIVTFFIYNHQKLFPGVITNIYTDAQPLMDMAFIFIFGLFSFIFVLWLWRYNQKHVLSLILFLTSWILFHAFMLSLAGRPLNVLEPRYLYFSAFPVFLIFSIFLYSIYTSKSKYKYFILVKKTAVTLIIFLVFLASFQEIRIAVNKMSHSGIVKNKVLGGILNVHPTLSKNTIFFIQCSKECYRNGELGISNENVLPFSFGPGHAILVTYASVMGEEKEWGPFLTEDFIFHYLSQGYRRIGDRSFGYFVDKAKLEKTLKENNLSSDVVVVLEYNEENYSFRDISASFRETINEN